MNVDTHLEERGIASRKEQAAARREEIIEAAVRLFCRKGFDGTSTKEISDAVGVSEGLIFHYFSTKSDVLSAVLNTRHGFMADLRELLMQEADRPAAETLPKVASLWFERLRKEKAMTLILLGTAQTDAKVGKALKHVIQSGTESLAAYLRLCISRGELRSDLPPETSAQMILSPIIVFFIRHRDLPQTDWDRLVRGFSADMLEVWFRGAQA